MFKDLLYDQTARLCVHVWGPVHVFYVCLSKFVVVCVCVKEKGVLSTLIEEEASVL